jgi:peptidoglycan/LPS O-acetylase OafA/YrhL
MSLEPGALLYMFFVKGADFQLYFIPLLVQFYILFPFIYRYCAPQDHGRRRRLSLFLGLAGLHILLGLLAHKHHVPYILAKNSFLFWGVYFYAGMMLGFGGKSKAQAQRWRGFTTCLALIAAILLYYAITAIIGPDGVSSFSRKEMGGAYVRPIIMIYNAVCIGVIALIIRTGPEISQRFFCWLGRNSLPIFIWHLVALRILFRTPIKGLCLIHPVLLPAVIFSTAIIVALVYEVWQKGKRRLTTRMIPQP